MKHDVWIKARVTPEEKERFRELAVREGRTESGQLKWLLQAAVSTPGERVAVDESEDAPGRDARVWVRLSADDRRLLRERARARQLPAATYVALLVRSHLLDATPLPKDELAAMKRSIAELAAVGRNLNQFVRALQGGATGVAFTVKEGLALIKVCEQLRDATRDLVKANAASWRGGGGYG
jgi:hypothetical protein